MRQGKNISEVDKELEILNELLDELQEVYVFDVLTNTLIFSLHSL